MSILIKKSPPYRVNNIEREEQPEEIQEIELELPKQL